jgi:hypothetical protein
MGAQLQEIIEVQLKDLQVYREQILRLFNNNKIQGKLLEEIV